MEVSVVRLFIATFLVWACLWPSVAYAQKVSRVPTGDTLVVQGLGTIRLLGVNALTDNTSDPRFPPCVPVTRELLSTLALGKDVTVISEPDVERLAPAAKARWVFLLDGTFLNERVLASGCAHLRDTGFDLSHALWTRISNTFSHVQLLGRGMYPRVEGVADTSWRRGPMVTSGALAWNGTSDKSTQTFTMSGTQWRLTWTMRPTSEVGGHFSVTVLTEDGRRIDAVTAPPTGGSDTTIIRSPPGSFYLKVSALYADWRVEVTP
jgi:hypothetical protein